MSCNISNSIVFTSSIPSVHAFVLWLTTHCNDPNWYARVFSSDNTYVVMIVMRCFMLKCRPVIPCTPVSRGTFFPSLTSQSTSLIDMHDLSTTRETSFVGMQGPSTSRDTSFIGMHALPVDIAWYIIRRHAWPVDFAWLNYSSSFNLIISQINFYTILSQAHVTTSVIFRHLTHPTVQWISIKSHIINT